MQYFYFVLFCNYFIIVILFYFALISCFMRKVTGHKHAIFGVITCLWLFLASLTMLMDIVSYLLDCFVRILSSLVSRQHTCNVPLICSLERPDRSHSALFRVCLVSPENKLELIACMLIPCRYCKHQFSLHLVTCDAMTSSFYEFLIENTKVDRNYVQLYS